MSVRLIYVPRDCCVYYTCLFFIFLFFFGFDVCDAMPNINDDNMDER